MCVFFSGTDRQSNSFLIFFNDLLHSNKELAIELESEDSINFLDFNSKGE